MSVGQPDRQAAPGETEGSALLCGHTTGIDCASGQRAINDFITFDVRIAKQHVEKYKGSWYEAGWFIRLPLLPSVQPTVTVSQVTP